MPNEGPFEIKIAVLGDDRLLKTMRNLSMFFRSEKFRQVLEDAKTFMVREARQLVPKKSRFLKASIAGEVQKFGTDNPIVRVGAATRYAASVEFGTKGGYPIIPRERKVLAWEKETGKPAKFASKSDVVWKKRIVHPGIKAQPFLRPALKNARPRLMIALDRLIAEELSGGNTGQ